MANYRRRKPALGWGGVSRTPIVTVGDNELSTGVIARGWTYWGIDEGGPYIPFFGAPAVHPPSSYGPVTTGGTFSADTAFTNWAVLGGWVDGGGIYTSIKHDWMQKTFSGLTPGETVGFRFNFAYTLDTGGGNIFGEIEGTTINRWSALDSGPTYWDVGYPTIAGQYITTVVPLSGDVIVRMGWENMGPTGSNGQGGFGAFEFVSIGGDGDVRPKLLVWGTPAGAGAPKSWPQDSRGSVVSKRFPSGRRAKWTKPGLDYLKQFVPWIPMVDRLRVGGPNGLDASGADGADGWRAALEYLRDGGIGTYYPDQDDLSIDPVDCTLVAPLLDKYDREDASLLRGLELVLATLRPGDVFPEY